MSYYFFMCLALFVSAFSILLFTYTQVDLSLTLSQQSFFRDVQTIFQEIGFYNRPVAALWYGLNLFGMIGVWFGIYAGVRNNVLHVKQILLLVLFQIGVLFLSYPAAFSYDIFNYIFTAKTVLLYKLNPYEVLPLWLEGIDPMLSFMRWTHLPSAYAPLWIILTIPFYALSGNILILSLFSFKLLPIIAYSICCLLCYQIALQWKSTERSGLTSLVLFAFNPVIVIESLVSAHNDIVMMLFALAALYFVQRRFMLASVVMWSVSVAIKLMTFPLGIQYFIGWGRKRSLILLVAGLVLVLLRREFLPWYIIWIIPFSVLIWQSTWLQVGIIGLSIGLLLRYLPVIYTGTYNLEVRQMQDSLTFFIPVLFLLFYGIFFFVKRRKQGIISV